MDAHVDVDGSFQLSNTNSVGISDLAVNEAQSPQSEDQSYSDIDIDGSADSLPSPKPVASVGPPSLVQYDWHRASDTSFDEEIDLDADVDTDTDTDINDSAHFDELPYSLISGDPSEPQSPMEHLSTSVGSPTRVYCVKFNSGEVYQCVVNGMKVIRRRSDNYVNCGHILAVAGVGGLERASMLQAMRREAHEDVSLGRSSYLGTW